ncbi:MAG: sigma-70 family RNA polymerase sigma factor, partial [Actinocrinis sp.]
MVAAAVLGRRGGSAVALGGGSDYGEAAFDSFPAGGAQWTPPSWDEVVRTHSARVYRLAYRLTGDRHDAEDLTQEVFVRVFRSLNSYTPGTFEGWLHRITTNLFLDVVRRKARIRFDALPDDAERLESRERGPAQ